MEFTAPFDLLGPVLQISLIDLLLSGDNAILIAMAARGLPEAMRPKAVALGTGAAVAFRVLLAFVATLALRAPYLKLVGGVLLLLIAIELLSGRGEGHRDSPRGDAGADIGRAILMIVTADAVMSLDNVVAVAAAAQDQVLYLVFGLLLSVPILVFSSLLVVRLLDAHPMLVQAGGGLLGWIAGRTAVSDPAVAATLQTQSFGLVALAPVLGAAYVLIQGRLLRERRLRPQALPRGAAQVRPAAPRPAPVLEPAPPAPLRPPVPERTPPAPAPAGEVRAEQAAPESGVPTRRISPMDWTILAGVAVPALGLVATLIYIIAKVISAR